jgi:putative molybdopterin biosynthesis protein
MNLLAFRHHVLPRRAGGSRVRFLAASAAGLDFVPIVWEPFDLLMRQHDYFGPAVQALIRFMRSDELSARAREMGGFDLADAGKVRYVV